MSSKFNFGKHLRELRYERGLSQEELAFECDMQPSHIGQIERGLKNPTLDTLVKIANGLKISLPELVDLTIEHENKEQNVTINRINAYLSVLSPKQQEQILAIIKTFIEYQ